MYKRVLLKLSGEALSGDNKIFDPEVLAKSGKMPTTADANAQLPRTGPPPVVKPASVGQKPTVRK